MRGWLAAALVAGPVLLGCAPTQRIPLDAGPQPMTLYVDGKALDPTPSAVELRADRDHALFFKSEGHLPELVVLKTTGAGRGARLEPASVRVRLAPRQVHVGREFEVQLQDEGPGEPGDGTR